MKKTIIISLVLIFLVFFLPWLGSESSPHGTQEPVSPPAQEDGQKDPQNESQEPTTEAEKIPTGERDAAASITVLLNGTAVEMDLGSYLVGVLRAEMPASFEMEALKAQAVAARTYTLYKILSGGSEAHPDADTCTDINCCKAYMDAETAAAHWGAAAAAYEAKLRSAVTETDGECVLYDGQPVLAVFHSSSAGMTMNAQDVWSSALPYLTSVSSPETAEQVPNFCSTVTFTTGALRSALLSALPDARLSGNASDWFTALRQQTNGTITALNVGGVEISGNRLRTILGLRSACFTVAFEGDNVIFSVTGYGHGVGLSQYGANILAQGGMDYREILAWYYTDTSVEIYEGSEGVPA